MTTLCLGFHEGAWVYINAENDGALYRCGCGSQRWLNYMEPPPPATLRWEAT